MEKTVIVLGCAVKNGKPGRIMMSRLQTAIVYLKEHEAANCIVTGAAFGDISEASCMENYLLEHGITKKRIFFTFIALMSIFFCNFAAGKNELIPNELIFGTTFAG